MLPKRNDPDRSAGEDLKSLKTVVTAGTFDLLHYGHLNLLKRARKYGDRLIVCLTGDDYGRCRGKTDIHDSEQVRRENLLATGLVEEVVISDGTAIDRAIEDYGADSFVIGEDYRGAFDYLRDRCEVIYLPRTEGISSTLLRESADLGEKTGDGETEDGKTDDLKADDEKMDVVLRHSIMALLWVRESPEYRALAYQAFNIARLQLDAELARRHKKPVAVVVDFDETIISTIRQKCLMFADRQMYTEEYFHRWMRDNMAEAMPGAREFLDYADSRGVTVFLVSNRDPETELELTYQNCVACGFPIRRDNIYMRRFGGSKQKTYAFIEGDYDVACYLGDSLDAMPIGGQAERNREAADRKPGILREPLYPAPQSHVRILGGPPGGRLCGHDAVGQGESPAEAFGERGIPPLND